MADGQVTLGPEIIAKLLLMQARAVVSPKLTITIVLSGEVSLEVGAEQAVIQVTHGNPRDAAEGLLKAAERLKNHEGERLIVPAHQIPQAH